MAKPSVVVYEKPGDQPEHWRGFAAGLCFIFFFTQFVPHGRYLVVSLLPGRIVEYTAERWLSHFALTLVAFCMFLVGRNVWHGRYRCWNVAGVVLATCCLLVAACTDYRDRLALASKWVPAQVPYVDAAFLHPHVTWLLVALGALWLTFRPRSWVARVWDPWRVIAAVWMTVFLGSEMLIEFGLGAILKGMADGIGLQIRERILFAGFASISLGALLLGGRWSFWGAFSVGMLLAVDILLWAWAWPELIQSSIQALLISCPHASPDYEPWRFYRVLNLGMFQNVFVDLPYSAGPWFLIAWYARKVPMRTPVDDGSPYPRRYCGKCLYNLHGVEADRCPECGNQLVPAPT